jgi:hypothetical protein
MDLLLDIAQGVGLAALGGVRPLPVTLVAGGLAAGDLGLSFDGTPYSFLEAPAFLAALAVAFVVFVALAMRGGPDPLAAARLPLAAVTAGALLFAGSLADRGHASWPGLVAGALCAALAVFATRELLRRAVRRAGDSSRSVGLAVDGLAALGTALVVLAPPLALLVLGFLARLALAERARGGDRYAGLRVLR